MSDELSLGEHRFRSRLVVGIGVVMIFLATVILPFQFAGQFQ